MPLINLLLIRIAIQSRNLGYYLLIGDRVSKFAKKFAKSAFRDVIKLQNAGLSMEPSQTNYNVLLRITRIMEKVLGHLFIIASNF